MSEYHCIIEKTIKPDKEERKVSLNETEKRTEYNQGINEVSSSESFLDKLFKVKNLNFLLVTVLIYTMLNNKDFNNDDKLLHTNYGNLSNTAYAHTIVVEDQFRRLGYGLKLLKECINVAKHSGYDRISSSVKKNNMPSQNMVKKTGFKQHYSDGNKDLFILELD